MKITDKDHPKLLSDFSRFTGRLGILGGSFDPVHEMHLEIAHFLLGRVVDNVVFVPAAQNPLKKDRPTLGADRLAMLLLAVSNSPHLFVSPIEIDRGSTSYTVETLRVLRACTSPELELCWIVGDDCLSELPSWREVEEIFKLARVVVVQRGTDKDIKDWQRTIDELPLSTFARKQLVDNFQSRPGNPISATRIRTALRSDEEAIGVPALVGEYIKKRGLYRG